MRSEIYDCTHFTEYLQLRLPTTGKTRGLRSKLAKHLNCQTGFISQVLNGYAQFSLEHAYSISQFLKHTDSEEEYFLLLANLERASTSELKAFYEKQLDKTRQKRSQIKERIQAKEKLSLEDQQIYYSQWYYAAIHVLVSLQDLNEPQEISDYLGLPLQVTNSVLEFLIAKNFIVKEPNGKLNIGKRRIHLDKKSQLLTKHHTNWRIEAIKSLEHPKPNDLHFSAVYSLSHTDYKTIHKILLNSIEQTEKLLPESKDEVLCCLNLDLFTY